MVFPVNKAHYYGKKHKKSDDLKYLSHNIRYHSVIHSLTEMHSLVENIAEVVHTLCSGYYHNAVVDL